jgi:hypothetical protein
MRWEAPTRALNTIEVVMSKGSFSSLYEHSSQDFVKNVELLMYTFTGERKFDTLLPKLTSSSDALAFHEPFSGNPSAYATYIQAIFV